MEKREQLRSKIEKIALCKANDAVRLALMGEEAIELIDKMDLASVAEFKRGANGSIEVKFVDRIGALEWLCETESRDELKNAESFFQGLEKSAED